MKDADLYQPQPAGDEQQDEPYAATEDDWADYQNWLDAQEALAGPAPF